MEKRSANAWNIFTKEKSKEGLTFEQQLEMWRHMDDAERRGYVGPVKEKGKTLNIRCSLSKFTALVENIKLNSSLELEDSPFKFLLKLKGFKLDTDLIRKLVTEFDRNEKSLKVGDKNQKLTLTFFDHILKIGEGNLTKMKSHKPSPDIVSRYISNKYVCMKKVKEILERKEDVDDFKRAFALVCLQYVVCAPSNGKLGKKFLQYVKNVEDLKSQPWAGLAMRALLKGISTFQNPKGYKAINLGGPMVFLQLYYLNQVTNKEPEELISLNKERNKSLVKSDEVGDRKQEIMIANKEAETSKTKEDSLEILKDEKVEEHDEEEKVLEEHDEHDEDTTCVGPFIVRTTQAPDLKDCKLLEFCFEKVADTTYVAGVGDGDAFDVRKDLWESLRPKKWLSIFLINHVVDMLSVREALKEDIQRWYFPTTQRAYRIYSSKTNSKLKHYIKKQQLKTVKQIFFPMYNNSHFYLIVFNNEQHKVEILDTIKRQDVGEYKIEINFLCQFLDEVIRDTRIPFKQYAPILVDVPQQPKSPKPSYKKSQPKKM